MVKIIEELVRKRSEHNEGLIGTLEELSLHQEDIEKIEHLNNWCKDLQILYLQANIISKIENLNKLKKLQYLNLAINNIEKIENLERCESLEKLDLTLNFIGDLESVCSLRENIHLRNLNLTGNPCAEYVGYREYVIAKLTQIERLDSKDITRSERIKAQQNFSKIEDGIKDQQSSYQIFRNEQKRRLSQSNSSKLDDEQYWKSSSEHAPETRVEMAERSRRSRKQNDAVENKKNKEIKLFTKDGRPLNKNQAKIPFTFSDENPEEYLLTISIYKYLDTQLINVDLQPIYARISIKNKIFQIVFPEEILTDKSTCQRSATTGHLTLKMPRANYRPKPILKKDNYIDNESSSKKEVEKKEKEEYLEVEGVDPSMDYRKIVENNEKLLASLSEIPPLEYGY